MTSAKGTRFGAAVVAAAIAFTGVSSAPAAHATNTGTVSGHLSDGCEVYWRASAVLDSDLTNDDSEYPGLMVDLGGAPVHYTNGGYIEEVTPALGDPGLLEMNHFYVGSGQTLTQMWRLPLATDYTINDATLDFTLPLELQGADVAVTFDPVSTNARIKDWGPTYAKYSWAQRATAVDNGNGSWTVDLGDLPRGMGTVFQFNVAIGTTGLTPSDRFVASAALSGTYPPGTSGGNCAISDQPALPTPTSELPVCTAEMLGQTLWSVYDADITVRTTSPSESQPQELGEVGSDGGGAGAEAWGEGATRAFSLYAASHVPLVDVTYVIDAVQGLTFDPASVTGEVSTPGAGHLTDAGYVEQVEGVTIASDAGGTQLSVHVDRMPALSSLSFDATGLLDGTRATMALNHRLVGTVEGCAPREDSVETSAWIEDARDCEARTVTGSRTVTTTGYLWDRATLTWIAQAPEAVSETRQRDMTASEVQECSPPLTPGAGSEPAGTVTPTTTVVPAPTVVAAEQLARTGGDGPPLGLGLAGLLMLLTGGLLMTARQLR